MGRLILRCEENIEEKRTILTPSHARELILLGLDIYVESSDFRCFKDFEYEAVGCKIVNKGFWISGNQIDLILGVKLFSFDYLKQITGRHACFAHVMDNQNIAPSFFSKIDSTLELYDLEFCFDKRGNRAFSFSVDAGRIYAVISLLEYFDTPFIPDSKTVQQATLSKHITTINSELEIQDPPSIAILGNGLSASGIQQVLNQFSIPYNVFSRTDTENLPLLYEELKKYEIIFNAVKYNTKDKDVLINDDIIEYGNKIICDITCDYTKPSNPIRSKHNYRSHLNAPCTTIKHKNGLCKFIAIDNICSLYSKDTSSIFSTKLCPHLFPLLETRSKMWLSALNKFNSVRRKYECTDCERLL